MPMPGPFELIIILVIILLLFGGSRLAGLGKSTGRALKEFKEETKGLSKEDQEKREVSGPRSSTQEYPQPPRENVEPRSEQSSDVRKDL